MGFISSSNSAELIARTYILIGERKKKKKRNNKEMISLQQFIPASITIK